MNTLHLVLVPILAPFLSSGRAPASGQARVRPAPITVKATAETAPVPSPGDAADDAAFWVHPTDPSLSTVIATDKDSGIAVYDLAGNPLQFVPDGQLNNVDLRHVQVGAGRVALATSAELVQNIIAVYTVDPATRMLARVDAGHIAVGITAYGSCMYLSPMTGDLYCFVTSKLGEVQQFRLDYDGMGVSAVLVRAFDVGGQVEGCVADDEADFIFIGEETVGIWRYGAEPQAGQKRVLVDGMRPAGHLTPDVEGLTIYYAGGGEGYLLASSQGENSYAVYERMPPHRYITRFQLVDNHALGIDGTTDTDGIDVTNLGLGSAFSGGVFVAQDSDNPGANQNFKLVPWTAIARAATPPLIVDPTYAP